MKPEIIRCPTCGRRQRRSSDANRRYWALLHEISEQIKPMKQQYSSETWHEYFKTHFLGATEIELPNGKTLTRPHSTAELDKIEFTEYMTQVEAWAADKGVYLAE